LDSEEEHVVSDNSYWGKKTSARMTRRRALVAAAGVGSGALALSLVSCGKGGGSGGSSGGSSGSSGMVSTPQDTTAKAKVGGVLKDFVGADVPSLDPIGSANVRSQTDIGSYTYPRIMKYVNAKYPKFATGDVEGDCIESYELLPDKLQLTLKVRPGMKWDSRSPTSGRELDAQDILFSWNKFTALNGYRSEFRYDPDKAPLAPIESVTATDSRTVIMKLHAPRAALLPIFAYNRYFYVMPRESDSGFDPKGDVRGYGPWILVKSQASVGRTWRRNPDYYVKGVPYPDTLEHPIVTEYATQLAQFRAGNIWQGVVRAEDILQTKKDLPELEMRQADTYGAIPSVLVFGYEGDSPFKDQRVRQAVSMSIDREAQIDVQGNRSQFKAHGLDVPARYHTVISANWDGYWLDPQDTKNFGANHIYYTLNLAEAKKLLSAAGFANGFETPLFYNGGNQYGTVYTQTVDIVAGFLKEIGIRLRNTPLDYSTDYLPNYHNGGYAQAQNIGRRPPGYNGILHKSASNRPTVDQSLFGHMHKDGSQFEGALPEGGTDARLGDPEINAAIEKIMAEFDHNKQIALVQDFQRVMAKKVYRVPDGSYSALGFTLSWPAIGNYGVYRTWQGGVPPVETSLYWWVNEQAAPLKKT
jgi:ABC-type transport system substrate-binding protein